MTEQRGEGGGGAVPWHRRRWVRWVMVVGIWLAVCAGGVVTSRVWLGKPWGDAWSFSAAFVVASAVGQWIAAEILRRHGPDAR